MAESSEAVITFRLPDLIAGKLSRLAAEAPRLTGSPIPSRHQLARSILLEALDGKESITRAQISKDIRRAEVEFRKELPKWGLASDRSTEMAFLMLDALADCIDMGCFGPDPSEVPADFLDSLRVKLEGLNKGSSR